jgi:hypothetical protein
MIVQNLIKALGAIPQTSYVITNPTKDSVGADPNYSKATTTAERNFVSDLKTNLLKIHDYTDDNLLVNLELYKTFKSREPKDIAYLETKCRFFNNEKGFSPDLVIHENHENQNQQLCALECKLERNLSYNDFGNDLVKLMLYREILNYENLVFVIGNNDPKHIAELFNRYKTKGHYLPHYKQLRIIVAPDAATEPTAIVA